MTPISPVLPRQPKTLELETVIAKDQPEYQPLPAIICVEGSVITRWHLTWRERVRVLRSGNLYLTQLAFGEPLQPQRPSVDEPVVVFGVNLS